SCLQAKSTSGSLEPVALRAPMTCCLVAFDSAAFGLKAMEVLLCGTPSLAQEAGKTRHGPWTPCSKRRGGRRERRPDVRRRVRRAPGTGGAGTGRRPRTDAEPHRTGQRGVAEARRLAVAGRGLPAPLQADRRPGDAPGAGRGSAPTVRPEARRRGGGGD